MFSTRLRDRALAVPLRKTSTKPAATPKPAPAAKPAAMASTQENKYSATRFCQSKAVLKTLKETVVAGEKAQAMLDHLERVNENTQRQELQRQQNKKNARAEAKAAKEQQAQQRAEAKAAKAAAREEAKAAKAAERELKKAARQSAKANGKPAAAGTKKRGRPRKNPAADVMNGSEKTKAKKSGGAVRKSKTAAGAAGPKKRGRPSKKALAAKAAAANGAGGLAMPETSVLERTMSNSGISDIELMAGF